MVDDDVVGSSSIITTSARSVSAIRCHASSTFAVTATTFANPGYEAAKDLVGISSFVNLPNVLIERIRSALKSRPRTRQSRTTITG